MKSSLKNILMSGAAASAVVGGTFIAINSQQSGTPTQDNTETTSKPTPKVKEASSTPSVSPSSTETPSKSDDSVKPSQTSTEKKEEETAGQPKEDASSTSNVPSIQEKQKEVAQEEDVAPPQVTTVSEKVEDTPRTLNPTTTVRRVSEPVEKADVSKLNQTKKVTVSVPRKETPKTPTAVFSEAPRVQTAPQSTPNEVVEQPRVVEQPTTPMVVETPQPTQPSVSETPTAPPVAEQPTQPAVVETHQPTTPTVVETPQPSVVETPKVVEQPTQQTVVETPRVVEQPTQPEVVYEKGQPLVQEENPVGIVSEKGTSLVQEENPVGVVSEKGTPLVQDENPIGVVSEKGTPLVQEENPTYVVSEKGTPLVQDEKPAGVVSEKGDPEVREALTIGVVSEMGVPLVEPNKPLGIVFEKGEPEVFLGTAPEYKFKIVRREDVTPIATVFLKLGDFRREVGTKAKIVNGHQGNITKVYEDVVAEDGTILNSTLKSDTTTDPVYHVYRYGTKPVGSHNGEEGLYRLHEHTSEMDIVDFRQDITLTGEEIKALGQDEINRRASDESLENNITLANPKNWSNVTIANAPLSEDTIAKFNNGTYINHKNVGLEVLKLVNEERRRVGLNELTWDDELFNLTKERASELGKNGHIRFWNERNEVMTHVRDNKGTKWFTVANGTSFMNNWLGENLAGFTLSHNIYKIFSEKVIVEELYTQWRNSPSHYANMVGEHYRRFAFDMSYSTFWRDDVVNVDYLPQGIQGVQLFSS